MDRQTHRDRWRVTNWFIIIIIIRYADAPDHYTFRVVYDSREM